MLQISLKFIKNITKWCLEFIFHVTRLARVETEAMEV